MLNTYFAQLFKPLILTPNQMKLKIFNPIRLGDAVSGISHKRISNEAIKGWYFAVLEVLRLGMCVVNFRQTQRSINVVVPAGK